MNSYTLRQHLIVTVYSSAILQNGNPYLCSKHRAICEGFREIKLLSKYILASKDSRSFEPIGSKLEKMNRTVKSY